MSTSKKKKAPQPKERLRTASKLHLQGGRVAIIVEMTRQENNSKAPQYPNTEICLHLFNDNQLSEIDQTIYGVRAFIEWKKITSQTSENPSKITRREFWRMQAKVQRSTFVITQQKRKK